MRSPAELVREFHEKAGHQDQGSKDADMLRSDLIQEEAQEVDDAFCNYMWGDGSLKDIAKELADLVYVVYGTADYLKIDLDKVLEAVHVSNMTKFDPETGKPFYREDGKVTKGPFYKPADLSFLE